MSASKLQILLSMDIIGEFNVHTYLTDGNTETDFDIHTVMQLDFPPDNVSDFDVMFLHARPGNKAMEDGEFAESVCEKMQNAGARIIIWDESDNDGFGVLKKLQNQENVNIINDLSQINPIISQVIPIHI